MHRHKKYVDLPDCEVCSCGQVRYPTERWIVGVTRPPYGSWERPALGLVRIPQLGERS